jgi:hypothetical protein
MHSVIARHLRLLYQVLLSDVFSDLRYITGWHTGSLSAEEPVLTVRCSADIEMHELWQFVRVRLVFTPGTRCPG